MFATSFAGTVGKDGTTVSMPTGGTFALALGSVSPGGELLGLQLAAGVGNHQASRRCEAKAPSWWAESSPARWRGWPATDRRFLARPPLADVLAGGDLQYSNAGSGGVYGIAPLPGGGAVFTGGFDGTVAMGDSRSTARGASTASWPSWIPTFRSSGRRASATRTGCCWVATHPDGSISLVLGTDQLVSFGGGPLPAAGEMDVVVVRLSPSGELIAQQRLGDASSQLPYAVASVGDDLVIAGSFDGTFDVGGISLESSGKEDVFVMRLDASLEPVWARGFGSTGSDGATSVAVDPSGDVVIAGTFEGAISFDDVELGAVDGVDLFIAKLEGD